MRDDFIIFAVNGSSASGKTTIIEEVICNYPFLNLERVVTTTTRAKRPKEMDGKDYYFTDKASFIEAREHNEFIETAEFAGEFYGTKIAELERISDNGNNAIVILEENGMRYFKEYFKERIVTIFVYRDLKDIKKDLEARDMPEEKKKMRFEKAKQELFNLPDNNFIIYNIGDIDEAIEQLMNIIDAANKA